MGAVRKDELMRAEDQESITHHQKPDSFTGAAHRPTEVCIKAKPHTLPDLAVFSPNCPSSMKEFPPSPRIWGWGKFNFQGKG